METMPHRYLDLVIELSILLIDSFVVRVLDRGSENGVGENEEHDDRSEDRRLNEFRADGRSETFLLILVDVHEFQRAIVGFLQDLERERAALVDSFSVLLLWWLEHRIELRVDPTSAGIEHGFRRMFR